MFQQAIPRFFLYSVSLCVVFIIGIIGCGGNDDDNEWVGTWAMETIEGESLDESLAEGEDLGIDMSIVANSWTFNDDGTMEADFGVKAEVKEQGIEFSVQGSLKIMGTYSLSGSNYTLTFTKVVETGILEGAEPPIDSSDADTGTWAREGNTLTLNSDEDGTIVFKKK